MKVNFTTCPLCEANCGLEVYTENNEIVKIVGDKQDPFSKGYMCVKARALKELHEDPDRIKKPLIREGKEWREVSWEHALTFAVDGIAKIQKKYGNDAQAIFQGNPLGHSGKGVIYYEILSRLLGTKNIYSSASLDQLPQMIVAEELYGSMGMFSIPDVDRTDFMMIMGANPFISNGSIMTAPNIPFRLKEIQKRGGKIVVVDPRRTKTAKQADLHLAINPGTDAFFLLAFLNVLFEKELIELGHLKNVVEGVNEIEFACKKYTPKRVEQITGLSASDIEKTAVNFAVAKSAILYARVGVCVQEFGTLTHWLVQVINILTNNLDKEGGMMFTTPAIDFLKVAKMIGAKGELGKNRSRVNNYPSFRGEFPVAGLIDEMTTKGEGQIKSLLTVAGNPVLSSPNGTSLAKSLSNLEFMVSVDIYKNETTRFADVILPPCFALEGSRFDLVFPAMSVRNRIKYAKSVLNRPKESFTDAEILLQLTKRVKTKSHFLKFLVKVFPLDVFLNVIIRMGAYGDNFNPFSKGLNLSKIKKEVHGIDLGALQSVLPKKLFTKNKKINLASQLIMSDLERLKLKQINKDENDFFLIGKRETRSINSWFHNLPKLTNGKMNCRLMINSKDAAKLGLVENQEVELYTQIQAVNVNIEISDDIKQGVVCMPHGWGHNREGVTLNHSKLNAGVNINDILDNKKIDELSGTSILNGIKVKIRV